LFPFFLSIYRQILKMHAFSTGIFYFIFMTYLKSSTECYSYWVPLTIPIDDDDVLIVTI